MSDGRYMAAMYNEPVHYQDDAGSWQDIDNTLLQSTTARSADDAEWETTAGPVKVNQSNKLKPGKTVTYKTRDYTLTWGLEGAAKVRGTADTPEETAQGDARWLTLEHTKSRVVYSDAYPDMDVEYLLTPSQVAVYRSNINGFTLSHVYNTCESDTGMGKYGSGWRLNVTQTLKPVTLEGNAELYGVSLNGTEAISYSYENIGSSRTSTLVKTMTVGGMTYSYAYDELSNITVVMSPDGTLSYEHDALSQLTQATRGGDVYEYTYDNRGNILSVKENGAVIKSYTYGDSG